MKKQFLNLGKALNRAEQKSFNGGGPPPPPGLTGPCGQLGGTILLGKTEESCFSPGIWYEGYCWVCFE